MFNQIPLPLTTYKWSSIIYGTFFKYIFPWSTDTYGENNYSSLAQIQIWVNNLIYTLTLDSTTLKFMPRWIPAVHLHPSLTLYRPVLTNEINSRLGCVLYDAFTRTNQKFLHISFFVTSILTNLTVMPSAHIIITWLLIISTKGEYKY